MKNRYKLGILGGMGPLATCKLYEKIINHTKSACDQDHLEMVILNNCKIPDRTKAILEGGESPVAALNQGIDTLITIGCDYFIMPCNTAHYFKNQLNLQNKIQMIDMIEETITYINNNYPDKSVCVLCTNGTKDANIYGYSKEININYPKDEIQRQVMEVIYQTKAGFDKLSLLQEIINKQNYDIYLLACTELSVYYEKLKSNAIILDAMEILVRKTIEKCGKEYQ